MALTVGELTLSAAVRAALRTRSTVAHFPVVSAAAFPFATARPNARALASRIVVANSEADLQAEVERVRVAIAQFGDGKLEWQIVLPSVVQKAAVTDELLRSSHRATRAFIDAVGAAAHPLAKEQSRNGSGRVASRLVPPARALGASSSRRGTKRSLTSMTSGNASAAKKKNANAQ